MVCTNVLRKLVIQNFKKKLRNVNNICINDVKIKAPLGLTNGFFERGERGRAMHAGKDLYAQSSLV